MVWYGMVWYMMVWYGMVWYMMVWYCFICYEINQSVPDYTFCTNCNIEMHKNCFDKYNINMNMNNTLCPHCQGIGVIGSKLTLPIKSAGEKCKIM